MCSFTKQTGRLPKTAKHDFDENDETNSSDSDSSSSDFCTDDDAWETGPFPAKRVSGAFAAMPALLR